MNTGKDFTFVLDQDNIYKDANYHTAEKKKKKNSTCQKQKWLLTGFVMEAPEASQKFLSGPLWTVHCAF